MRAGFQKAVELDPELAEAYDGMGNFWNAKRQYDKAMADFDRAVALDPEKPESIRGSRPAPGNLPRRTGSAMARRPSRQPREPVN